MQFSLFSDENVNAVAAKNSQVQDAQHHSYSQTARADVSSERPDANHNTEDAGQELTYNKRNRVNKLSWNDIKGKDAALRVKETTKAKVYPKPDYEAIITNGPHSVAGVNRIIAYVVKQVYDSIANKPQTRTAPTDAELEEYITAVNRVMDGVMTWANDKEQTAALIAKVAGRAKLMSTTGPIPLMSLAEQAPRALLETVYPNGYKTYGDELKLIGGNKPYGALQPGLDDVVKAMKEIDKGWPASQEAWQRQGYRVLECKTPITDFYEGKRRDQRQYVSLIIMVKEGERYHTIESEIIDGATTKEDPSFAKARETRVAELTGKYLLLNKRNRLEVVADTEEGAKEKARELTGRVTGKAIKEEGISVSDAERIGKTRRMENEDITSEKLMETFGFKGVNFGNWMKGAGNEAERQLHLNHAYDAFMDLAEILELPPRAMGLNGMLGVAFGAQGSGKYAAHFVPGVNEINLTRTRGAGALAHEWGHGLDHYFARLAGLERTESPYLSEHAMFPAQRDSMELVEGKYQKVVKERFTTDLRPAVLERFKVIVETMNKKGMTDEELRTQRSESLNKSIKRVDGWLTSIKRDFLRSQVPEQAFEEIATRIRNLDLGEGMVAVSSNKMVCPAVAELRNLYKAITGRIYALNEAMGLQSNLDHLVYCKTADSSELEHRPQKKITDYAHDALVMDGDKGGEAYWSTNVEKFARAFDAYVSDKLAENAALNSYLTRADESNRTTPHGGERTAINGAMSELVEEIQTRETDKGIALYSFAGYQSETADRRTLAQAKDMLDADADKEYVRQETGWFRGPDGKMRYEISDHDAKLKKPFPSKGQRFGDMYKVVWEQRAKSGMIGIALGDILDHPKLYAAYPHLAEIAIETRKGNGASYVIRDSIDPERIRVGEEEIMSDVAFMLLHETQHGIQERENFARGGSPKQFRAGEDLLTTPEYKEWLDNWAKAAHKEFFENEPLGSLTKKLPPKPDTQSISPHEAYHRLAGEVEARNTQRRQKITAIERKETPPSMSADVAESDVIVVFRGKEMFGAAFPANAMKQGMEVSEIERHVFQREVSWPSMPPITVVETVDELPLLVREGMSVKAKAKADGIWVHEEGEVYLIANRITNTKQLDKILAHECVLHHSLLDMLGNYGFAKLHTGIQALKNNNDPVVGQLASEIAKKYGMLDPEEETREIVALAGERCVDDDGNIKVEFGFMKQVFAGMTNWLRDHNVKVPFSNWELQGLIHRAAKRVEVERASGRTVEQGTYYGKVIDVRDGQVIQKTGRHADDVKIHDARLLSKVPVVGQIAEIEYRGGRGQVSCAEKGKSLER